MPSQKLDLRPAVSAFVSASLNHVVEQLALRAELQSIEAVRGMHRAGRHSLTMPDRHLT